MDLREFYFQNIQESEYHHKFYDLIKHVNSEGVNDYQFEVYDVEEAITKFRELCQPEMIFTISDKCWFYLISHFI